MLPSNGYFKHIFCPYDNAKLCHRPYCHYKHAETDLGEKITSEVEETEYLFDTKPTTTLHHPPVSMYSEMATDYNLNSCYVPTPVGKCIKPAGILKANNSLPGRQHFTVPEYNPTPISRLNKVNTSHSHYGTNSYSPEYASSSRKKKKIEEYDPTVVKYVSKKSVMFADQAGIALDDSNAPGFSSDEEMDDSINAPKFSDDDLDDDRERVDPPKISEPAVTVQKKIEDEEEEEDVEEKNIDEFSLVDRILVDSKRNKKLLTNHTKKTFTTKQSQQTLKKSTKNVVESKKMKTKVVKNSIYKCDIDMPVSKSEDIPSDFDCVMSMASFDDLKSEEKNYSLPLVKKSVSPKNSEISKRRNSSELLLKEENVKNHSKSKNSNSDTKSKNSYSDIKSKKNNSDKKSKETSHTSKHSDKKTDMKKKHEKHSSSNTEKSTSSTKLNKTEKHKLSISKSDKSSSGDKTSKSEKNKSSVPSSKTEKSSSSNKLSKSEKIKTDSSKHAREKEAKLQDEKVTSSSIVKKSKHDQDIKTQSKTEDSHHKENKFSKSKSSKSSSKEDSLKRKITKRKAEDSDSESCSEKHTSKDKYVSKKSRNDKTDVDDDISSTDGAVDDIIDISSGSEDDTEEQCKRIFEETFIQNEESLPPSDKEDATKATFRDLNILRKKRLAHTGAPSSKKPGPSSQKTNIKQPRNPGQVMLDRFAQIRAAHSAQNEAKDKHSNFNSPGRGVEKKRISVVPNRSLLAAIAEKNRMQQSANNFSPLPSTVSKTLKVTKRVAHIPDLASKPRPIIPVDYGSKVPTVVRQKFLNAFIDEYLKFSPSEDEAYDSALEEEKKAYQRSSSKAIYMNVASNALNRLRHRVDDGTGKKSDAVSSTTHTALKTVSHETVLNGPQAQRTSFSIERKKAAPTPELKGIALYDHLMTYALKDDQLKENGYPFPHPTEIGRAVIEGIYANKTQFCNDPFKRTCCRCQKTYYVNVDGDYVRDEECDFHWGRLFKRRIAGNFESRYTCCQGDSESDGCCVGTGHVFEGSEAHALKGFVNTLPKTPPPDHYFGIYALDCEMCYTTAGIELTRISVIGPDLKPVYESFVKPQNQVLDYNTRFSGITEENLKNVRTTIRDVQAVLLCMFNTKTILIGHSLESDLKALKIFHKTVVDTSVVFPHKLGLPYKRALRNLTSEKLSKIIQNDVGGHDSAEDAVACMELMIWKIKEDLKGNR